MKRIAKYFFQGLLFLIPIAVTIYVLYAAFIKIDGLLGNIIKDLIGMKIPGVGFITTIALVTFIGFLASNILTRGLLNIIDKIFHRLPLVKLLYSSIKDLIGAFVGDKKKFDKPVLVTLIPGGNIKVAGFITRETMENWGLADEVVVYLPQSYNFAGNLIIVPKNQVTPIQADSSEVMTFIVSGGVAGK